MSIVIFYKEAIKIHQLFTSQRKAMALLPIKLYFIYLRIHLSKHHFPILSCMA